MIDYDIQKGIIDEIVRIEIIYILFVDSLPIKIMKLVEQIMRIDNNQN